MSLVNSENFALSQTSTFQNWENLEKYDLNSSLVEKENPTKIPQKLRVRNVNRSKTGHINITSLKKVAFIMLLQPAFKFDFNSKTSNKYLKAFRESYNLKSLIKNPTCFKNHHKPTRIDLIFTNQPRMNEYPSVIVVGLCRNLHKKYCTKINRLENKVSGRT